MRRYYQIEVVPRCLTFKRPAGTSRGVYTTRKLWEVRIRKEDEPSVIGIGECAPLPDLSCDYGVDYEITLSKACLDLEQKGYVDTESLRHYPSILFGLETAMRHYEQGGWRHYDTPFSQGQAGIPINGLIWMGDYKYMLEQVEEKMKEGFRCVDEELIGCNAPDEKQRLLETIHPQYIILKPSLHGGISGCTEWIHLAETILGSTPEQPKWWVTSALESQIGLNAIAQWCATLGNPLPQGLGTGEIFKDDKHTLIQRKGDTIWFTNDL